MTHDEKEMVQTLINRFDAFERRFEEYVSSEADLWGKFYEEFKDIKRGIYGDERNKQPGLFEKITEMEKKVIDNENRIFKLETRHYKAIAWVVSIGAALNVIYIAIKEIFLGSK